MKVLVTVLLAALMLFACKSSPEAQSGGDAHRNEAQAMPLDEWVTDDISEGDGDRTDWKAIDLADAGQLTVQLHADEAKAKVSVGVYSRYGEPLGETIREAGGERTQLMVRAPKSGRYFLRVRSLDGPTTTYTVRATLGAADTQDKGGSSGSVRPDF